MPLRFWLYLAILLFIGEFPIWKTFAFVFSEQFALTAFMWFSIIDAITEAGNAIGRRDDRLNGEITHVTFYFLGSWFVSRLFYLVSKKSFYETVPMC